MLLLEPLLRVRSLDEVLALAMTNPEALSRESFDVMSSVMNRAVRQGDVELAARIEQLTPVLAAMRGQAPAGGSRLFAVLSDLQVFMELAEGARWPDAFLLLLATSLSTLASVFAQAGRDAEAERPAKESVKIHRSLMAATPGRNRRELVEALNTFARALWAVGHRDEALACLQEALDMCVEATDGVTPVSPDVKATTLRHLGERLYHLSRHAEAASCAESAVKIFRQLAKAEPAAYTGLLAVSLVDLGNVLGLLGDYASSLRHIKEGVSLYPTEPGADQPSTWDTPPDWSDDDDDDAPDRGER